jgi:uncharacterized damage-inducible protein DinB
MNKLTLTLAAFGCAAAFAQQPPPAAPANRPAPALQTMAQLLDRNIAGLERNFVGLADALPEAKWDFAPTAGEFKGVRTFASQAKHVATVNYLYGARILGEASPIVQDPGEDGPKNIKTKAEIMTFLKESFAYLHKAVASVTPENAVAQVPNESGSGTKPIKLTTLVGVAGHIQDHYGQMVVYLRMNGQIPPASAPRTPPPTEKK